MLQDIRKSTQGTAAKVIIGLIVISFALFGIESILLGGGGGSMAEVNGEEISEFEVQQAINNQKRQLISMLGDNLDPAMLDDDRLRGQAVQTIVNRKLLTQSAAEMQLAVSEQEVGAVIGGMDQFYIDGQFSSEMYKSVLANAGFTPASFKQGLVEDLLLNQLRSGIAGSDFATASELATTARVTAELRDVRYLTLPLAAFRTDVQITEEEIVAYYDANQGEFLSEETVELDYIELHIDDFRQPVSEDQLIEEFELVKSDYEYQTENRVSHILFEQADDESEEALLARVEAAQAALQEGRAFDEVATEMSDDIGSSAAGGDLGYSAGDAFPSEMEEAIAALSVDQVSEAVTTDAGIHLILLTDRREGKAITLDDIRMELQDKIQLSVARGEILLVVENLRDQVFNAADLAGPAQELGLTVASSAPISRAGGEGVFANQSVVAAAFSEDVLELGHNSEVVEISSEHFVALRVRQRNEAQTQPLAQVRDGIAQALTEAAARDNAAAAAEAAVLAVRGGQSVEAYALANDYEWQVELAANRRNAMLPRPVLQRVFQLPAPAEGTRVDYVATASGDMLVFELSRVSAGDFAALPEREQSLLRGQLAAESGSLVQQEFQQGLYQRADISVL